MREYIRNFIKKHVIASRLCQFMSAWHSENKQSYHCEGLKTPWQSERQEQTNCHSEATPKNLINMECKQSKVMRSFANAQDDDIRHPELQPRHAELVSASQDHTTCHCEDNDILSPWQSKRQQTNPKTDCFDTCLWHSSRNDMENGNDSYHCDIRHSEDSCHCEDNDILSPWQSERQEQTNRHSEATPKTLINMECKQSKVMRSFANAQDDEVAQDDMKKSAFTLIETIMTLFVISVVITASIMIFTGKHNATGVNNVIGNWNACEDSPYAGLCTNSNVVINPVENNDISEDKYFTTLDAGGNIVPNNTYYNLVVGLFDNIGINNYFRSETGNIKVGEHVIKVDSQDVTNAGGGATTYNNFYISSAKDGDNWIFPASQAAANFNNNVVIGNPTDFDNFSGTNNVIIGNSNTVGNNNSDNTILGHNNNIGSQSNNFIFGNSNNINSQSNNVIIGNNNKVKASQHNLIINTASNKDNAYEHNIQLGNNLYADKHDADNNYDITFNDNVTINGQVHALATLTESDIRLKNIKSGYNKGLDEILQLQPVSFYYNKDETATAHVGVIAQDLQKVFPEAVTKMKKGYLGVDSAPVFFATINALREVNIQTIKEEHRTQALELELKNLEKEINELSICKSNSLFSKFRCWWIRCWQRIGEVCHV